MYLNIKNLQKSKQVVNIKLEFFICCIVLGLEFIHVNNILHRDIKPENMVLDEKGYVRITDFGIAKFYQKENSTETSGTPGYMSPEVMCGQNHTIAVDYFALGVIAYEFMIGVVSFYFYFPASLFGKE
jgi:serine/threonine protein kinase